MSNPTNPNELTSAREMFILGADSQTDAVIDTIKLCVETLQEEKNQNQLENFVYGHLDTLLTKLEE